MERLRKLVHHPAQHALNYCVSPVLCERVVCACACCCCCVLYVLCVCGISLYVLCVCGESLYGSA